MTREQIKAEVNRRLAAGEITAAEHGDFMKSMDAIDAKRAAAAAPIPQTILDQFKKVAPKLDYLAARWLDEQEYEEFSEYVTAATKGFPEPFKVLSVTKRPFAVKFSHPCDKRVFQIKVGRKISLETVR